MIFLGAGGTLEVVGYGTWILLSLALYYTIVIKKERKKVAGIVFFRIWCPFLIGLFCALVNVSAPGYFYDHEQKFLLWQSISGSLFSVIFHVYELFAKYPGLIPTVAFILLTLGSQVSLKINGKTLVILLLNLFIGNTITAFPVCMGYDVKWINGQFGSRTGSLLDLTIEINLMIFLYLLIAFIVPVNSREKWSQFVYTKRGKAFSSVVFAIVLLTSLNSLFNCMSIMACRDLVKGRMQKMEEAYTSIDARLANGAGNDVVINKTKPEDTVIGEPMYGTDPILNQWFVQYYKLNSLVVNWQ